MRKLESLDLLQLAQSSGFQTRRPQKLDIVSLVGGFWLMILSTQYSLSSWCQQIWRLSNHLLTKQGLDKRLRKAHRLGELLLEQVLKRPLGGVLPKPQSSGLFQDFPNVYVEDSTCVKLPAMLHAIFSGPHNRHGKSATARIQLRLNLLKEGYSQIKLQRYRDSDAKYGRSIVSVLKAGDLVIRDLGYWSIQVFQNIADQGAYFLSRWKYPTHLYHSAHHDADPISLVCFLKKAEKRGQTSIDLPVFIGKKYRMAARLVAIKAPQQVTLSRKRKAEKNRDRRLNHTKEYYYLLGWTIWVTNVPNSLWKAPQLLEAYRFRWRIEVIFKCWKSKFKLEGLLNQHRSLHPARAWFTLYLFLSLLVLFYARWLSYFIQAVYYQTGELVSPLKFADFAKNHFTKLLMAKKWESLVPVVAQFAVYEKRKRANYLEWLWAPLS